MPNQFLKIQFGILLIPQIDFKINNSHDYFDIDRLLVNGQAIFQFLVYTNNQILVADDIVVAIFVEEVDEYF